MFTAGSIDKRSDTINDEELKNTRQLLQQLDGLALDACRRRGIGAAETPFGRPANFVVIVNQDCLQLTIDGRDLGQLPLHCYLDARSETKRMAVGELIEGAKQQYGFEEPVLVVTLASWTLNADHPDRDAYLRETADNIAEYYTEQIQILRMRLPHGWEEYRQRLQPFLNDHPDLDKNVLVMMRFRDEENYERIYSVLKRELGRYGFSAMRADDRDYTTELWPNVCTYLLGCSYGVAVFEEIDEREFNPNVALELGFMRAHCKRCLLLKDRRMPTMPTDIVGHLYKEFDTYQIDSTVSRCVAEWMHDLGIQAP